MDCSSYLGGDDAVVGVTLRDVGLSSRRGFFMPDVYCPVVHPVLLPHALTEREREREINSNIGREKKGLNYTVQLHLITIHNLLTIISLWNHAFNKCIWHSMDYIWSTVWCTNNLVCQILLVIMFCTLYNTDNSNAEMIGQLIDIKWYF